MKPPLKVERVLYESGPVWWLRDANYRAVAQNIPTESEARLIMLLVNDDYEKWQRPGTNDVSDANEAEMERVDED